MKQKSKLLWGEGMFLSPQHFQRQDAYHEALLHETGRLLQPFGWGVRRVRFDKNSLATNALQPLEISVMFPDGELYTAPDNDELPPPMSLEDLPQDSQEVTVLLALPMLKEHGGNCARDESDNTARYRQRNLPTTDAYTNAADVDLTFLDKAVRLICADQQHEAVVTVPLARLRRTSTGHFELDDTFMPPVVNLAASPRLQMQLRSLLNALQAKAEALYGMHREPSQNIIEFRSGDIASFWLLHTVNTSFAALLHLHKHPETAVDRLFQELSRLAGSLLTFSPTYRLSNIPEYNHGNPGEGFGKLFRIIHELIDTVISARYFGITLTEVKPSHHLGHIESQKIDQRAELYLGVNSSLPATELVDIVPVRFKVGAPDDVESLVASALPGVHIRHQPQVPSAIPVRPGCVYFALEARGNLYERMLKSQSVMIYVPSGIPELKLELIAVTP